MQHNNPGSMRRVLRAVTACAVAGLILGVGVVGKAHAEDDDDLLDVRIMRNVMRGLGLKRGDEESINYRERSPLVVPPDTDFLPPPQDASAVERNPDWPQDPDVQRVRQAAKRQKRIINWTDEGRALRPDELNRGVPRSGDAPRKAAATTVEDSQRVMSPTELGFKGWGSLKRMFGGQYENESGSFVEEPKRTELTQPPPGYLTPSPEQPYGVGKENAKLKAANPMDHAVGDAGTN